MPRGDQMNGALVLFKGLILGPERSGKTDWALKAAEAGFNVLMMDGDIAGATIESQSDEVKRRLYYMELHDNLVGDSYNTRMIDMTSEFFASSKFLWNDSKQQEYSRSKDSHNEDGSAVDEVWEFRPSRLDHRWVIILDSWTSLSYSAMLAKAQDLGVKVEDVEKVERNIYQGVGNRLTNILHVLKSARCHVIVLAHGEQYEKRKSQDGKTVKEAMKENDQIVEWTKMIPTSSSKPHGYKMGKHFAEIGWIDVNPYGKRVLDFTITSSRTSGGHLQSKGDPRVDHRFEDVIKKIGAALPDKSDFSTGEGLTIYSPNTFIPATPKPPMSLAGKKSTTPTPTTIDPAATPTAVKGIGGLGSLMKR